MHAPKSNRDTYIDKARNIFILFQNMILKILNSKVIDGMVLRTCYIYIYIYTLKIKPNSVRIRLLSCQIFFPPLSGFELTPLIHCNTNRLALYPNSRSATLSRKENLEIDIRHVSKRV